jgi:hypothetical protein
MSLPRCDSVFNRTVASEELQATVQISKDVVCIVTVVVVAAVVAVVVVAAVHLS